MAREPNLEQAPRQAAPVKKASMKSLLWVFMLAIVIFAFPESVILLFLGLLPTVVALIIDKSPKKYSTFCVGSMNITGVFPAMLELWAGQNNISHAIEIITNVFDLIVMYAAATFGWLLFMAIPPVVNGLLAVVAQHRIAQLRSRQRELIKEWGDDIIARPLDQADGVKSASGQAQSQTPAPPSDIEDLDEVPPAPS